ncbi:MAG: M18 family aminopeptidase [Candidatus Aminicenantes bacterium]|nr:M18 family aminopeptidase [Candidatus Aminicenantes bacterium]
MIEEIFKQSARELLEFIEQSPTAAHAVGQVESQLAQAGFRMYSEQDAWLINPGDRVMVKRQESGIIAVKMGKKPLLESGFKIIGAHTDSPGFRLKPRALMQKGGYLQLGVEIYGGPLLATWLDRDLGLAGLVVIKDERDSLRTMLLKLEKPVVRISMLPIHLNREVNDLGLVLNKQEHLAPILGIAGEPPDKNCLENLLAGKLGIAVDRLVDWELGLFDLQPGTLAGLDDEFIISARIDNLAMCQAALAAFLKSEAGTATQVIVFYDNEEIGSTSANGAGSSFLRDVLTRLVSAGRQKTEDLFRALARSFFISADGAHAVHPNYIDKYEKEHHCRLNQGPVIKINALKKYATTAESSATFILICQKAGVPFQKFVNRTDMAGGSTIGPTVAAGLGIPTVDVGNAMLSMHSIREMSGTADHLHMIRVFEEFFKD